MFAATKWLIVVFFRVHYFMFDACLYCNTLSVPPPKNNFSDCRVFLSHQAKQCSSSDASVADSTKEQPSLSPTPLLLRFPSSLQPQFNPPPPLLPCLPPPCLPLLLCIFYTHAHRTGVEVAHARHDASLGDHGDGAKSTMAAMAMSRLVRMPPSTHRMTRSRRPSQFFYKL